MDNNLDLAVMQGRLLPKYLGRYQAHPIGYWHREFEVAKNYEIGLIEFILDYDDWGNNPLMSEIGINEITQVSLKTGVFVKSACADFFMEAPLHGRSLTDCLDSQKVLIKLIHNCAKLGINDIVIPCVDQSSLREDRSNMKELVKNMLPAVDLAEKYGLNLALETDLPPKSFADLLEMFSSPRVTVNYDIGNSASLGYDPIEELVAYGNKISNIHIKDRILNGGSVELGTGSADFKTFFTELSRLSFKGIFVMQAFRDDEGLGVFKKQLDWIKPFLWAFDRRLI